MSGKYENVMVTSFSSVTLKLFHKCDEMEPTGEVSVSVCVCVHTHAHGHIYFMYIYNM